MNDFSLNDVLGEAVEIEYKGERLFVIDRALDRNGVEPYITTLDWVKSEHETTWIMCDIKVSELMQDSNLKVFHATRVGFQENNR